MGTSGAYGGSSSTAWSQVRDAWTGLGDDSSAASDDAGGSQQPPDHGGSRYDELGQALGRALDARRAPAAAPTLADLLPRRRGGGGGASGAAGGGGTRDGYRGRTGTRTGRSGAQQAARGGAAVGAAYAYRARDSTALGQYGITLAELDSLSPRMRCARLLDLVLGDAGHPDEAAARRAAAKQLKKILDLSVEPPTAIEAVRDLVGEITLQLGLVELKNQILAQTTTPEAATRREKGLRSWIRAKVRGLNLGKYGMVSSTDCHRAAYRLWRDAQRLIGGFPS